MEEVAGKNCRRQAKEPVDSRTAPPGIGMINNIIMQQGGNMQVFKSNGQAGICLFL